MEKSLINALAYAKRKIDKGGYSFNEIVEDAAYAYYLRQDEIEILKEKLAEFYKQRFFVNPIK